MGSYSLPRNVKGEGRILFVFSTKALIYSAIGAGIGMLFYFVLSLIGLAIVGVIISLVLGLIGFLIGTFKIPDTNAFDITKKTGGEAIDDVIKRLFLFRKKKNKIYVYYTKEEVKQDEQ